MLDDPYVPDHIKGLLKQLESGEITVVNLTQEVRDHHGLTGIAAAYSPYNQDFHVVRAVKTANDIASESATNMDMFPNGHVIFVTDGEITSQKNALIKLVHELAHVKADNFIKKNLDTLVKNLPDSFMWIGEDGIPKINSQY